MADLPRTLAVRLDSDGDVLLMGPALRALRAGSSRLDLLVAPTGLEAARLLPGIDEVLVLDPSWTGLDPAPVDPRAVLSLVEDLRARHHDTAVVFTSYHQSPLPMALVARLAGIAAVAATSDDHPGSLLDVRHRRLPGRDDDGGPDGGHEVAAALRLAEAAGFPLPSGDDGRLRLRPLPVSPRADGGGRGRVVVHPGASVPSRAMGPGLARAAALALLADGWDVVVTGGPAEREACIAATPDGATCLAGHTSLAELAAEIAGAVAVVVGNTGPAHLAAAVGTPVVSLFSPVVPLERWRPWGVPHVVLGDQHAACRGTRARECPVPGHPCLSTVSATDVSDAVRRLAGIPTTAPVHAAWAEGAS
ncbi:glycosyltransferase family 9 protein [Knoellia sp. CPCC 206450]|uniref:glycosyltransferase family 9 protein n=1 Tax=Knoellia tibetensis TaxID=3404798 RepID=UPI003B428916